MNLSLFILAILTSVTVFAADTVKEPTVLLYDNGDLTEISVEEYVAGVVAHEMPHTFSKEALKAQAVAARTYMYYCIETGAHPHAVGDVCADIWHCCGYTTEGALAARFGEVYAASAMKTALEAAKSTKGQVLFYDGEPIMAVWHSSSYGATEDCGDVWLHGLPYLVSVPTAEDAQITTVRYTVGEVQALLEAAGYAYDGTPTVWQRGTDSGRCAEVTFGNVTVSAGEARRIFSLKSTDFTVYFDSGSFVFNVYGYGHGVGMSQYGAEAMAGAGAGYCDILAHYYSGAYIMKNYARPEIVSCLMRVLGKI